jgi:hypothetical protein
MSTVKQIQRKDLMEATGALPYTITYLTLTNRLPLLHRAIGRGDVNLYAPEAIQIIKNWISRRGDFQDER